MSSADQPLAPSIDVKHLSYAFPDGSSGLKDVFLDLPPGSRTLLIGGTPLPQINLPPPQKKTKQTPLPH